MDAGRADIRIGSSAAPSPLIAMTSALVASTLLAGLLLAALVADLRSRRIPNSLVLAGLTLAFGEHAIALALRPPTAPLAGATWWAPLAGLLTGFALLLPHYLLRAMGAGDVKLMAMVGAFVGPTAAATAVLYTLIAGGLLSLVIMFSRRGVAAQTFANLRFLLTDWVLRATGGQGVQLTRRCKPRLHACLMHWPSAWAQPPH